MSNFKFLNIDNRSINTPIYRVIKLEWFMDMLHNNNTILVKPELWDDPFEEFLSKQDFLGPNGENFTMRNFGGNFYCQCWTLEYESDFMWRVYASNNDGIKLKTTLKKLREVMIASTQQNDLLRIGQVEYLSENQIRDKFESESYLGNLLIRGYYHSLLVKKDSFKAEQEIRLIYKPNIESDNESKMVSLTMDPNIVLEEVVIHPRVSEHTFRMIKDTIQRNGFTNPIYQSNLYSVPKLELKFNWAK